MEDFSATQPIAGLVTVYRRLLFSQLNCRLVGSESGRMGLGGGGGSLRYKIAETDRYKL